MPLSLTFSDLHCGDQQNRHLFGRFQTAFPAALELALEQNAEVRFLGDTFDLDGALITPQTLAEESEFFTKEIQKYYQASKVPISIMAGNHDEEEPLARHLQKVLPNHIYSLLPGICCSPHGELMTHGHLLEEPKFLRIMRRTLQEHETDESIERIEAVLYQLENTKKVRKKLHRRHQHLRRLDRVWKALDKYAPKKSFQRIKLADHLAQHGYHPFRTKVYDRVNMRTRHAAHHIVNDVLYPALSGAESLMIAFDETWAFLRGHDHVPTVEIRSRGNGSTSSYLHGNTGSFLSVVHPPTAILSNSKEQALTLLVFEEAHAEWREWQTVRLTSNTSAVGATERRKKF